MKGARVLGFRVFEIDELLDGFDDMWAAARRDAPDNAYGELMTIRNTIHQWPKTKVTKPCLRLSAITQKFMTAEVSWRTDD